MSEVKNKKKKSSIIQVSIGVLAVILAILIIIMMGIVSDIQGTARIVNYTGLVRGETQSRDEAYKFCGHLTILDSGQALTTGETKKLFERPGILQAARLTGCKNFSAVQKMGEHNIYAVDWDLMLQTKDVVPDDVTHVGIRGHWMKGSSEGGENRMEVEVVEYIETTFEHQYLLKNKKGGDCQPVWWMCPKEDFEEDPHTKVPKYIHFPAEHLMLLKEAK